jgi:hypothetical protein
LLSADILPHEKASLYRQLKFCTHTAIVYFFYAIGPWSNTALWAHVLRAKEVIE